MVSLGHAMKLLFNGCSFVAGDCLTWHRHYPDIDPELHIWGRRPHPKYSQDHIRAITDHYWRVLRPQDNLAAQVSRLTGLEAIDISADGNSNQAIALSTIAYITENPGQYIACLGWTEPARSMAWDYTANQWINLNVHRMEDPKLPPRYRDLIAVNLVGALEPELMLNYAHSLITVNTWLRSQGVSSVQWRSMGQPMDPGCLDIRTPYGVSLPQLSALLDAKAWLGTDSEPWVGTSWFDRLTDSDCISAGNRHPNLKAVEQMSQRIADHLAKSAVY